ncbi:LigA [Nocardioidaceae bacterium Broad-1]|nr:LigA [Nocardioidaceae bacterium Broad-1]
MSDRGHIELDRAVDSITIGVRHRIDLGDLSPLMASIERIGVLQPITIAPDGTLLCGRRRLEAVKRLGWRTVRVWVRSGISDGLNRLLALQDENLLHKPFSPTEAADLYRELRQVMKEDADRRQAATRFGSDAELQGSHGGVDSTPPSAPGKTRSQAATAVTGMDSHQRLDRIGDIQDLAADSEVPGAVREVAAESLTAINNGGSVNALHEVVDQVRSAAASDSHEDIDAIREEAIARIKQPRSRRPKPAAWSARAFVLTWSELDNWWTHYDPVEIGRELGDLDWDIFECFLTATNDFARAAREARAEQAADTTPSSAG